MPGIDYNRLRREISMRQVLELLSFSPSPSGCRGDQWYGSCPLPACASRCGVTFSVHVSLNRYTCHRCKSHGNQLELWSAFLETPLYPASLELCLALKHPIPWIHRW